MKGEEVARMLLKAGADPYATCSRGAKPCARANGQTLADIRNAQTLIDLDRIAEGFGIKTAMAA